MKTQNSLRNVMPPLNQYSCSLCAMSHFCLPLGVEKKDLEQLDQLVKSSTVFHQNDYVFKQGKPFSKVYAVKAGSFKSSRIDENGNERVIGFHLPGELIGLDGIYPGSYSTNVSALDTASLCEMNFDKLTELCGEIPTLQRQLLRLLSRDIYDSNVSFAEKADQTAIQKLAGFLHNLSIRYKVRGYSPTEFNLAMSRQDIASYLGLTPETISRLLKRFKQDDILTIENRHIQINDQQALEDVVACDNV